MNTHFYHWPPTALNSSTRTSFTNPLTTLKTLRVNVRQPQNFQRLCIVASALRSHLLLDQLALMIIHHKSNWQSFTVYSLLHTFSACIYANLTYCTCQNCNKFVTSPCPFVLLKWNLSHHLEVCLLRLAGCHTGVQLVTGWKEKSGKIPKKLSKISPLIYEYTNLTKSSTLNSSAIDHTSSKAYLSDGLISRLR